jgi:predicted permease
MITDLLYRLRALIRRGPVEDELDEELRFHLERETQKYVQSGMSRDEASRRARLALGGLEQVKEECRSAWGTRWLEERWHDVRYGARQLRLCPGFAFVVIASLALGIGANTAIFQLIDAVRLRSLPVERPRELAEVRIVGGNHGMGNNDGQYAQLTRPMWHEIRARQQGFAGLFAWSATEAGIGKGSELRRVNAVWVSGDFFGVLGIQPWRGRLFLLEDEGTCPESRAVVSHAYWQREMGGRELGPDSKLMVNGRLQDVIGVTPPQFFGLAVGESFDVAQFCHPKDLQRELFDLAVVGRLRPGWTIERASAQLEAVSAGIFAATVPAGYDDKWVGTFKKFRLAAYSASGGVSGLRRTYDSSLWFLLAISGLVLLIACANLANLMLSRASAREREMAVRLAIGASRGRLLRQLLAEGALLAVIGAAIGTGLARVLSRVLVASLSTENAAVYLPIETNWHVLLFAALVAALTCAVFGVAPALRATKADPMSAMKSGGRGGTPDRERFLFQRLMVVTQIAVSLVLLVGALLFVRSFRNLMTVDPGMRQAGITVMRLGFLKAGVTPDRYEQFKRELLEEVRAVPGIMSAATTTYVPMLGGSWGHRVRTRFGDGSSKFSWVSPGYFTTLGIPLLAGRDFNENDSATSVRVAVVNQTFVRQLLGGASPIGQRLRTAEEPNYPSTEFEIVGVLRDTKYNSLRGETPPMAFAPASQLPNERPWTAIMIHSDMLPASAGASIRRAIAERHPEIVMDFSDFQGRIREGLMRERLMATLSGFFGLLAAMLVTVGLYGVVSYLVARRRQEIGIRIAMGAPRQRVVGMVMREAGRLLSIGLVIGGGLSLAAGRSAGSLLFELTPYDPFTLTAATVLLVIIVAAASFLPARRAAAIDPMVALRHD